MKIILAITSSVLAAVLVITFIPVHGEQTIYDNIIRLHVIAKSDSEEDQSLKLAVRDSILNLLKAKIYNINDHDEALEIITDSLDDIEDVSQSVLEERGCKEKVSASVVTEHFPVRYYDNYTLPSGEYKSLKVEIGAAEGKNWWCVLFPSICSSNAKEVEDDYIAAGFTSEQYNIISNNSGTKYKVRFKILEILSDVIGFDY